MCHCVAENENSATWDLLESTKVDSQRHTKWHVLRDCSQQIVLTASDWKWNHTCNGEHSNWQLNYHWRISVDRGASSVISGLCWWSSESSYHGSDSWSRQGEVLFFSLSESTLISTYLSFVCTMHTKIVAYIKRFHNSCSQFDMDMYENTGNA